MKRAEALSLIGQRVSAWTPMNGTYSGILVEVTDDRPWRGKVRIDGVLECWCVLEFSRRHQRCGLNLGEVYEFGGVNIKPTEIAGLTKRAALYRHLAVWRDMRRNAMSGTVGRHGLGRASLAKGIREIIQQIRECSDQSSSLRVGRGRAG